ncbi:MAG: ribokinase [Anaerolineae bacterium]|nr:ribokinase [Anaerolineae bacterium]
MKAIEPVDYLVIGHVTKDVLNGGFTVGGTATYSALTARNFGYRVGVVTSADPDLDLEDVLQGVSVVRQPAVATTTFQNIYVDGARQQFIRAVADDIRAESVPPAWRNTPIVHVGPVSQEGCTVELVSVFTDSLIGMTPQGWMRQWDDQGRVFPRLLTDPESILPLARAVILSEEDVGGDLALVESYARLVDILVLTAGWKGATVYHQGQVRHFPAREVQEVDPTGAGDIFATAYLICLRETGDPWAAARFANCVASGSVERAGLAGIPSPQEIAACRAQVLGARE